MWTHIYYFEIISITIEIIWVTIIFLGLLKWLFSAIKSYLSWENRKNIYKNVREEIAHSILLWLEILIAVDIIKTVTTDLTIENTLILWLIVVIRTILSISLEVEIENRFPWSKKFNKEK